MYRRAMLDQIGGFDEDFFAYADDAELGLRAQDRRVEVPVCSEQPWCGIIGARRWACDRRGGWS